MCQDQKIDLFVKIQTEVTKFYFWDFSYKRHSLCRAEVRENISTLQNNTRDSKGIWHPIVSQPKYPHGWISVCSRRAVKVTQHEKIIAAIESDSSYRKLLDEVDGFTIISHEI